VGPAKSKENIRKHRVSFEEAETAILDALSKTTALHKSRAAMKIKLSLRSGRQRKAWGEA
jgi:uncharacterized DUF497 family protein